MVGSGWWVVGGGLYSSFVGLGPGSESGSGLELGLRLGLILADRLWPPQKKTGAVGVGFGVSYDGVRCNAGHKGRQVLLGSVLV